MSLPKAVWQKTKEEAKEAVDDIKDYAEEAGATAESKADSWLDKLKASPWTAAIIGGALAAAIVLGIFALFVR